MGSCRRGNDDSIDISIGFNRLDRADTGLVRGREGLCSFIAGVGDCGQFLTINGCDRACVDLADPAPRPKEQSILPCCPSQDVVACKGVLCATCINRIKILKTSKVEYVKPDAGPAK